MVLILCIHWVGSPERIILKIFSFSSATPVSTKYKYTWLCIIPCSKQPSDYLLSAWNLLNLCFPFFCIMPLLWKQRKIDVHFFFFLLWHWNILNVTHYFKVPHSLHMIHCLEIFWWSPVISFQNRKIFWGSNSEQRLIYPHCIL